MAQLKEAENRAIQEGLIHPNVSIKYVTFDDKCEQEYATSFSMFAYFDNCVHVAFGPICDLCVGKWQCLAVSEILIDNVSIAQYLL